LAAVGRRSGRAKFTGPYYIKVYAGKLSTGQRYLIANQGDHRHTLMVSVSRPDKKTFSKIWKIRHGFFAQPRYPG